eukprot:COSAG02_NODE_175_length_31226_cov_95.275934_17_plen_115_part_00
MSTGVVAQVLPMHLLDVDAYELLGLDRGRNYGNSDINKAYRRASLKVHPDKEGGDRTRFEQVTQAYDVVLLNTSVMHARLAQDAIHSGGVAGWEGSRRGWATPAATRLRFRVAV